MHRRQICGTRILIITTIPNFISLPLPFLASFSRLFPIFMAFLHCWDPTKWYSCLVFQNRSTGCRGMRGSLEILKPKMANQVFRHSIPLFSNLVDFFRKLGPKQLELSQENGWGPILHISSHYLTAQLIDLSWTCMKSGQSARLYWLNFSQHVHFLSSSGCDMPSWLEKRQSCTERLLSGFRAVRFVSNIPIQIHWYMYPLNLPPKKAKTLLLGPNLTS